MKLKVLVIAGVAVALAAVVVVLRIRASDDASSRSPSGPTPAIAEAGSGSTAPIELPDPGGPVRIAEELGVSQTSYPINLEVLRSQIPDNLYWQLDAPTSDVAVAKQRAERAKERNTALGRIQANEASEPEIRAYYDERRQLSKDYLQLTQLVLEGKAGELSERDRGLFELTSTLHRERLVQIDRDQSDALGRIAGRGAGSGSATGSGGTNTGGGIAGGGSAAAPQ